MVEIVMAVYQRPNRFPKIVEQLKKQTHQDFRLNVWDNSGRLLDLYFGNIEGINYRILNTDGNRGGGDRFKLIPFTTGNPIISLDDDENVDEDFVEYHLNEYEKWGDSYMLGWYSKILNPAEYQNELFFRPPYGTEVDFIGSGGMVVGRSIFDKEPKLINMPDEFVRANDIYMSAVANKLGYKMISIEQKCQIVNDGLDSCKKDKAYKEKAFSLLRQGGWELLKDLQF